MTTTPLAWHNRPDLKAEVVSRMREHRAADEIVQGCYQLRDTCCAPSGYRGCALGCALPLLPSDPAEGWHARVERDYGIPERVAELIDNTFEDQRTFEDAADFAVAVIEAIPVGADLTGICDAWLEGATGSAQRAAWLIDAFAAAPVPEMPPAGAACR